MPALNFHSPLALWLLLLVPVVIAWGVVEHRSRAVLRFPATHVFKRTRKGFRSHLLWVPTALRALAVTLAVIALARPQRQDAKVRDLSVEGIDIMIALDLSTSMEAADFRPKDRLHVAKEVLTEFIGARVNDRVGLVVFAGEAHTQAPLTLDYAVLKEVVRQLRTRVLEDGTAIGDSLAVSLNRLRDSDAKSRVIVLITDGDNNAGKLSPMDSASMAKALGIPIYTILVGKGGKVPFPHGTDLFGNPSWRETEIPINPELLQSISSTTGGEYYRATDRASLKEGLQKVLDSLERSKLLEGGAAANYQEEFHAYLFWAFVFAALDLLARATVLRVFP
jgi:Ca-activated chloride channel family protein